MADRAQVARVLVAALGAAAVLVPRIAAACPSCAGQNDSLDTVLKLLGLFLLVPFAIVGTTIFALRRAARLRAALDSK